MAEVSARRLRLVGPPWVGSSARGGPAPSPPQGGGGGACARRSMASAAVAPVSSKHDSSSALSTSRGPSRHLGKAESSLRFH